MAAVTLKQMAGAYINYIKQQMQIVQKEIEEKKNLFNQLEAHLKECIDTHNEDKFQNKNQQEQNIQQNIINTDRQIIGPTKNMPNLQQEYTKVETIKLPNPFEQLGIQ